MKCYKPVTEGSFLVHGTPFALCDCTAEEETILREAIALGWYIRMSVESSERSGGWSGTRSSHHDYRDIKSENAVLEDGRVIGFRLHDDSCDPEVRDIFFSVDEIGIYHYIDRTEKYSFDGGDGDGESSHSFALERKDPRIVQYIETYRLYIENDLTLNGKTDRVGEYRSIRYDEVTVGRDGEPYTEYSGHLLRANREGAVIPCGTWRHTTVTLVRR